MKKRYFAREESEMKTQKARYPRFDQYNRIFTFYSSVMSSSS